MEKPDVGHAITILYEGYELVYRAERKIVRSKESTEATVLKAIQNRNLAGRAGWVSLVPHNESYYKKLDFLDTTGNRIDDGEVFRAIESMLSRNIIENISGQSRGNGLCLTEKYDDLI
jgi:hypothetical protein